MLIAQNH